MILTISWRLNLVWTDIGRYVYLISTRIVPKNDFFGIPDTRNTRWFWKKSGMDRVLLKIIGSGRVSGTRQSLAMAEQQFRLDEKKYCQMNIHQLLGTVDEEETFPSHRWFDVIKLFLRQEREPLHSGFLKWNNNHDDIAEWAPENTMSKAASSNPPSPLSS